MKTRLSQSPAPQDDLDTIQETTTRARENSAAALQATSDQVALEALAEIGWWLGLGLASLSPVFSPDRIVVGGGISAAGDMLLDAVRASYLRHASPEFHEKTKVIGSTFDGGEGMVGAASLFLDPLTRLTAR